MTGEFVVVRGAGDIATGALQKLVHAGFRVVALDLPHPTAIRWKAALSTALVAGRWSVEDVTAVRAASWDEASDLIAPGVVPVIADPDASVLAQARPDALVDAILAKRNLGMTRAMAPVTVGVGPGFTAGVDVDYVIETMRGHHLGRVLTTGSAIPNTGVPGLIGGRSAERVLHAPAEGSVRVVRGIGDIVAAGETICEIVGSDGITPVPATIDGLIRGMIPDGTPVPRGFKIADIDPRTELVDCVDTISDKARAVGGGVLDAVLQGLVAEASTRP